MLTIFLGFFLVSGVFAQSVERNSCPLVSGQPLFNMQRHLGTWYEIQRSGQTPSEFFKCQIVNFRRSIDESVKTEVSLISEPDGQKHIFHGKTSPDKKACRKSILFGCAHLSSTFENSEVDYTILETDYTSYAIVFACRNFFMTHSSVISAFTRDPKPDQAVLDKISAVLKKHNLQHVTLERVDQDCA